METFYNWFMSRPKPKDDPYGKWNCIEERYDTSTPKPVGGSYAKIEVTRNFNGSGPDSFGGAEEWAVIKAHIACPLDMSKETAETLMHDIRMAIQKAGYHIFLCPHCKQAYLAFIEGLHPYTVDHWQCPECGSTYNNEENENVPIIT